MENITLDKVAEVMKVDPAVLQSFPESVQSAMIAILELTDPQTKEEHYNNPERLQQLVDSGDILSYLTAIDDNVWSEIMRQKERWQLNNKEYLLAEANGDFVRQAALANMFVHSAKETIYPKMVYV